jgi:hypothetical protein
MEHKQQQQEQKQAECSAALAAPSGALPAARACMAQRLLSKEDYFAGWLTGVLVQYKNPAIMCSFGKDSMVMLHLMRKFNLPLPIVFYRDPWFPKKYDFADRMIAEWGLYPLTVLPKPIIDERTHYLEASDFYQVNDKWQMHYSAQPLPQVQVAQAMRSERDRLLAESDWVVAKAYEQQTPVPDAWVSYRQKLRDLTEQQEFPWVIDWPTVP